MSAQRERFHLHGGSVSPGSLRALCVSTQVSVTHSDSVLAGTRPTPAAGGSERAFSSATTYSLPPMCKARARRQHWPRKWHPHALSQPGSEGVLYPPDGSLSCHSERPQNARVWSSYYLPVLPPRGLSVSSAAHAGELRLRGYVHLKLLQIQKYFLRSASPPALCSSKGTRKATRNRFSKTETIASEAVFLPQDKVKQPV